MNLAPHLTLLLLAPACLAARSQESTPTQAPAPIVRPAAPNSAVPTSQHLTVSHPVEHPQTPAASSLAPAVSKPRIYDSPAQSIAKLPSEPLSRSLVVLDPAHGGGDTGSRINDQLTERDITLSLGFHLRSLLAARGFTVTMTRDNEQGAQSAQPPAPGAILSLDDRAGIANHGHPVACLLLHATASGKGVHLYTSELDPISVEPVPAPWLSAQAAWSGESRKLASQMGAALSRAKIPLVLSRASVRPVDSLTCPAVVLELAPNTSDVASLDDPHYQQRVAEAVVGALLAWQTQAQAPARPLPPVAAPSGTSAEARP